MRRVKKKTYSSTDNVAYADGHRKLIAGNNFFPHFFFYPLLSRSIGTNMVTGSTFFFSTARKFFYSLCTESIIFFSRHRRRRVRKNCSPRVFFFLLQRTRGDVRSIFSIILE